MFDKGHVVLIRRGIHEGFVGIVCSSKEADNTTIYSVEIDDTKVELPRNHIVDGSQVYKRLSDAVKRVDAAKQTIDEYESLINQLCDDAMVNAVKKSREKNHE